MDKLFILILASFATRCVRKKQRKNHSNSMRTYQTPFSFSLRIQCILLGFFLVSSIPFSFGIILRWEWLYLKKKRYLKGLYWISVVKYINPFSLISRLLENIIGCYHVGSKISRHKNDMLGLLTIKPLLHSIGEWRIHYSKCTFLIERYSMIDSFTLVELVWKQFV